MGLSSMDESRGGGGGLLLVLEESERGPGEELWRARLWGRRSGSESEPEA